MVGSNISMRLDGHTDTATTTTGTAEDHTADGSGTSSSSNSSVGQQQGLSSAGVDGMSHEETLGTATVYRSKTKELEEGEKEPGGGLSWLVCWAFLVDNLPQLPVLASVPPS